MTVLLVFVFVIVFLLSDHFRMGRAAPVTADRPATDKKRPEKKAA
jgi:hypothetical protein